MADEVHGVGLRPLAGSGQPLKTGEVVLSRKGHLRGYGGKGGADDTSSDEDGKGRRKKKKKKNGRGDDNSGAAGSGSGATRAGRAGA